MKNEFMQVSDFDKVIMSELGCKSVGSSMRDIFRARDIYALDRKQLNTIKSDRVGALNIALGAKFNATQLNALLKGAKTRTKKGDKIARIDLDKAQIVFIENFVGALPRKARDLFKGCDTRAQHVKRLEELIKAHNARKGAKKVSLVDTI